MGVVLVGWVLCGWGLVRGGGLVGFVTLETFVVSLPVVLIADRFLASVVECH